MEEFGLGDVDDLEGKVLIFSSLILVCFSWNLKCVYVNASACPETQCTCILYRVTASKLSDIYRVVLNNNVTKSLLSNT